MLERQPRQAEALVAVVGGDDLAGFGVVLAAQDGQVVVEDAGWGHAGAADGQAEQLTFGEGVDGFHRGGDGAGELAAGRSGDALDGRV